MTLAMPKLGLVDAPQVGELYLADISVPLSVYRDMGFDPVNPFTESRIVRVV
jgi:NAD(P)H-hydrate epimerase